MNKDVVEEFEIENRIDRLHGWFTRLPIALVAIILVLVSILRSGVAIWNWFSLSPRLLTDWSEPTNPFQSNVLFNALGTLWQSFGGAPNDGYWLGLQFLVFAAAFSLLTLLVLQQTFSSTRYLTLALVLSTGLAAVLSREIGRYDQFFIVGIALAVLAKRPWLYISGAVIAALTAPEQLLAGSILFALLTLISTFGKWRARAVWLLAASLVSTLGVQIWFSVAGNGSATRLGILGSFLAGDDVTPPSRYDWAQGPARLFIERFYDNLSGGYLLIWSYLGVATFALILVVLSQKRPSQIVGTVILLLVAPLVCTTIAGDDPSRDTVLVAAPMLLVLCVVGASLTTGLLQRHVKDIPRSLDLLAVAVSLLPLVYVFQRFEFPFNFLKLIVISLNNGTDVDWTGTFR